MLNVFKDVKNNEIGSASYEEWVSSFKICMPCFESRKASYEKWVSPYYIWIRYDDKTVRSWWKTGSSSSNTPFPQWNTPTEWQFCEDKGLKFKG